MYATRTVLLTLILCIGLAADAQPAPADPQSPATTDATATPDIPADAAAPGAAPSAEALAKQLANPIANLISVPFQINYDAGSGPDDDGERVTLNIQPVIPVGLNEDWNLITRTIVPVIYQNGDVSPLSGEDEFGLGDTVASLFFSPKKTVPVGESGQLTWGVGPVFYLPTATEDVLGADQWGLGPTGVALIVDGPWTYGLLANHIWSLGETEDFDSFIVDRPQINATFLQPFVVYAVGGGWTVGANLEATYDWEADQWTIPAYVNASRVFSVGGQMMSLNAGPRYYLEGPDNAPDWGARVALTFIFPK